MKPTKYLILLAVFAVGFGADVFAADKNETPRVSMVGPSGGKTIEPGTLMMLVVEGATLSYEGNPIAIEDAVSYVNNVLKTTGAFNIGVLIREGVKYGDVVKAVDTLRSTNARNIGVSMTELAAGRQLY